MMSDVMMSDFFHAGRGKPCPYNVIARWIDARPKPATALTAQLQIPNSTS